MLIVRKARTRYKTFFLKSKKEFQIRPEELGRSKTHPTGENSNKEQSK
jgi:hypothetical protein